MKISEIKINIISIVFNIFLAVLIAIKMYNVRYVFYSIQAQLNCIDGCLIFSKGYLVELGILSISIVWIYIIVIKKYFYSVIFVSLLAILYFAYLHDDTLVNFAIYTLIVITIIHLKNLQNQIIIITTLFNLFITINVLINNPLDKYIEKNKIKISSILEDQKKVVLSVALKNECSGVSLISYKIKQNSLCSFEITGSYNSKIINRLTSILDSDGIVSGYTGINYEYNKNPINNEFIVGKFIINSKKLSKKYNIPNQNCFINTQKLFNNVLINYFDCNDNLISINNKNFIIENNLLNGVYPDTINSDDYKYYGTYIGGDKYKGKIEFKLTKENYFEIITGPSSNNSYIEVRNPKGELVSRDKLKIYNVWTKVKINELVVDSNEYFNIILSDEGDQWGQWLGLRFSK
jgi:hypothetical protein